LSPARTCRLIKRINHDIKEQREQRSALSSADWNSNGAGDDLFEALQNSSNGNDLLDMDAMDGDFVTAVSPF
jgi:hypothetical protein